jgi:hypothetical protein
MIVTFGVQTLTGAAQPVMGDVLTAALPIPPDGVDPIVTVASTKFYQVGFRFTVDPETASQDSYKVAAILSSTTMQCSLEGTVGHAHSNGAIIQLSISCADVCVQALNGGAGPVVIGTDNTVTVTPGGSVVKVLDKSTTPAEENEWRMTANGQYNTVNTADAWMIGTANDKVLVYALVI